MRDPDENGWQSSAPAWIDRMSDRGDFSRLHVLDTPMLARVTALRPETALDVGCGEGRFCRMMAKMGVAAVGVDPIPGMVEAARKRHPDGDYHVGFAEALPVADDAFDLVVSYLTLIDIDGLEDAVAEMARVTAPGGRILVANLTSFSTSSAVMGPRYCRDTGEKLKPLGRYLSEEKLWFEWDGLRIQNWHRPLSTYMQAFLSQGLILRQFDEPAPECGPPERVRSYARMPYLMMMEWEKPALSSV
ncbi:class I SAM-dependent methyltransferase [Tateyamaria sp. ANG-S1]|uniref:class I SAM-dependent methyltransferase n=1 Tax=Tateyamaria sp. ANG-S1 TaxID=1577905 RepID=UPI00057C5F68|nr:class I SAM-dependent methyltransferase [Tateyamaria sp. ANG-S1]KIC51149.1 methyltransferase [Tateyamaria sp. ANG-S1]